MPATRFDGAFFNLRTGLAGEIMQKFVNYHLRLVIIGDLSGHLEAARPCAPWSTSRTGDSTSGSSMTSTSSAPGSRRPDREG